MNTSQMSIEDDCKDDKRTFKDLASSASITATTHDNSSELWDFESREMGFDRLSQASNILLGSAEGHAQPG